MPFQIPEDITALDAQALNEAIEAALAEAGPLNDIADEDLTDEQVSLLTDLGGFVTSARSVQAERTAAQAARNEKVAGARAALTPVEEAPAEEVAPEAPAEEVVEERQPESVAASGAPKRSAVSRAAEKAPAPVEKTSRPVASLVAAADVPDFPTGSELTLTQAGEAVMARLRGYPQGEPTSQFRSQHGAVVIRKTGQEYVQDRSGSNDTKMLFEASREKALPGESLVAAGGWGAPSETLYDLCSVYSADGLLDLPEVTVTRGGMKYTKGLDFDAIFNSATGYIDQTEAQAEAGTAKTALRPEVPDFVDVRLEAVGLFIEAGLLLRAGWPEVIDQTVEAALIAHQHKVSNKLLNKIQGYTGAAIALTGGFGNALDVLHLLEVVATGERHRFRMGVNATLEVLLPHWVKPLIRADLANRTGVENFLSISDAQIDGFFSARNLRVQWLYNYQEIDTTTNGVATDYPTTVEAIMYPAGTYVKGTSPVIRLDTVYDSTNLRKNDYIELFLEEGVLVANPCNTGRRISLPLVANGRTAAADITANFGAAVV